ncbi:hypothetical protein EJ08DRAFT_733146 [Tothia fuscella]|uniref:histidine kinase n=1 Tax=Tothia fuscella TaxID=1048955 RepID=A0A9P4TZM0_9PEZI|nr:hypothetical protein EJ08DRAFT_733146 [Tothia fuscella]
MKSLPEYTSGFFPSSTTMTADVAPVKSATVAAARERDFYRYYNIESINLVNSTTACSSHDATLTAFAQLGALRLRSKRCLISLFSAHEQHIIAEATQTLSLLSDTVHDSDDELWLGTVSIPRDQGICHHAVDIPVDPSIPRDQRNVVIRNMKKDERTKNLAYVKHNHCGEFFAGVPMLSPKGWHIGTYCVLDDKAREGISLSELHFLQDMATTVMTYLELTRTREEYRRGERMVRGLGSFHEGKATLRNWRPVTGGAPGNEERTYELNREGHGGEGQLNVEQQEAQASLDQEEKILQDPADSFTRLTEGAGNSQNTNALVSPQDKVNRVTMMLPMKTMKSPSSGTTAVDLLSQRGTSSKSFTSALTFTSGVLGETSDEVESADRLSLQEDMLSTGVKAAFSRASNIIRESIEVEGSIFVDAAIGSYGGFVYDDHDESNTSSELSGITSSGSDRSHTSKSSKSSKSSKYEHMERMCGVLGFSTSSSSSINNSIMSKLHALIPENLLKGLVKRYPRGKIFNFTEDGQASSGSSSEATCGSNNGFADDVQNVSKARARRKADRRFSRRTDAEEIIKLFPGARSIAITPLWDSHRSRWFSLGVVWTQSPERVLSVEGDLSYLASFGNTIMAEVARLDALTADKAKTDLLGSISHELRSPLHGILGSVELLEESIMGSLQANLVNCIETCGRTLLDTIDHLLDFTKINHSSQLARDERGDRKSARDAGGIIKQGQGKEDVSVHSEVDICATTEEVLTAVSAGYDIHKLAALRAGGTGRDHHPTDSSYANETSGENDVSPTASSRLDNVAVSIDIEPNSSWIFATQAGAWRRIVMNLFSNSLKYTDEGFINVTLRTEPMVSKNGISRSRVLLNVIDSGRGMSKDYLQGKLFTPFAQENQLAPGTGLGLSIIRQIIRNLGGRIEVRSKRGIGTHVSVAIPMAHSATVENSPAMESLQNVKKLTTDLTICLPTLDRERKDLVPDYELASLRTICEGWYGMQVHSGLDSTAPDIHLVIEDSANYESLKNGQFFQDLKRQAPAPSDKTLQVIVICRTPSSTNILERMAGTFEGGTVIDFIYQPCGPRKLGRSLLRCFKKRDELLSSANKTPHIPLHDYPTPPPQEDKAAKQAAKSTAISIPSSQKPNIAPIITPPEDDPVPPTSSSRPSLFRTLSTPPFDCCPFLLVDDNHINLQVLQMFMKKNDFSHTTASDGLEALEKYKASTQTQPFKTILMGKRYSCTHTT